MPDLLLAIDAGTTNLRVCLFTPEGDLVSQATAPVTTRSPGPGLVEQDADEIWRSIKDALRRVLLGAGRSLVDLAAIGVTSQRTSAVLWDRATGAPLTPLVVWSDLRGVARAGELYRLAGVSLAPQQAATKLEAMVAAATGTPTSRLAFGNIDTYLIWKLTGGARHVMDRSQAWPTGYLDLSTLGWNTALMTLQGLDASMFPRLTDTWGPHGETDPTVFGAAVPITADIADQQAALIGQGCEAPGEAKVSYGTSATLDVSTGGAFLYPHPTFPPFVLSSVAGDNRFCLEGMVYTAGSALDWVRDRFAFGDHAQFEALAAGARTSGGVAFLPSLSGTGAPHGDPNRRGLLSGLNIGVDRGQIALAALEGVAFRVCEIHERVYALTELPMPAMIRADGGLTASDTLMQLQADLLGLPVMRHGHREATAAGAAICAARGIGLLGVAETAGFVRHDRTFEPRISADEAAARRAQWSGQAYPDRTSP